jgi:hypothetical protein
MPTERLLLNYFSQADLRPFPQTEGGPQDNPPGLLSEDEVEDLRALVRRFTQDGDVVVRWEVLAEKPHMRAFVLVLQALGALLVTDSSADYRLRITGRLARHLPEILFIYLTESLTLIDNWDTVHVMTEDTLSAYDLVRQLELRRIELTRRAGRQVRPLAVRPVSFAIFHAVSDKGEDCYLFEINKDWRRLNFIGGKQEAFDGGDFRKTIIREIGEELGIAAHRLTLTRLNDEPLEAYGLSGNAGSLAGYPCVFYGVRVAGPLPVRMQDRWLTEAQIRVCSTMRDGPLMVNPVYLDFLLSGTQSRLAHTPISVDQKVHASRPDEILTSAERPMRRWVRVLGENKDILAAMATLAAALITLVVTF